MICFALDFRRKTIQLKFVDNQIFFGLSKLIRFHIYWILCCSDRIVLIMVC